jgi:hypothetical protein
VGLLDRVREFDCFFVASVPRVAEVNLVRLIPLEQVVADDRSRYRDLLSCSERPTYGAELRRRRRQAPPGPSREAAGRAKAPRRGRPSTRTRLE